MKIDMNFDAIVLTKKDEKSKDGQTHYYRLGIMLNDELGELGCTQEVHDAVSRNGSYHFTGTYNSEYKSLRVTGATPLNKK